MECNKDDALKAKELAEEKLLKKDYGGARIFAMKARDLDPNLVGLPQLLAAIEVNISAERRVNGQIDWYGVFGVQPLADDATIRECYQTLTLRNGIHPIPTPVSPLTLKETFWTRCHSCRTKFEYHTVYINCKLICTSCRRPFLAREAPPPPVYRNDSSASRISQMKQHNFNSTRIVRNCHASGRTPMYAVNSSLESGHFSMLGRYEEIPGQKLSVSVCQNGFCNNNNNMFNAANCEDRDHRNGTHPIPSPVSPVTLKQTFWTSCHSCRTQFEYHTVYINCKLICTSCRRPFLAHEAPPPPVYRNDSSASRILQMKQHNFNSTRIERNCHASGRTPMYAVNSSLESGHFSMPGRYEEIPGGKLSVPARQNGFYNNNNNIFNTANCEDRNYRNGIHPILSPVSPVTLKQTFWTRCHSCRTQFEYYTVYINRELICTSCHQPFLAHESPPPPVYRNDSSASRTSQMKQHNFNSTGIVRNCHASGRTPMYAVNSSLESGHFSMPGGISSVPTPASAAAEAPVVYGTTSENLKRRREDSAPIIREEGHFGNTHAVVRDISGSAFKSSFFGSNSVQIRDSSRKISRTDESQVHGDGRDKETKITYKNGGIKLPNEFGSQKDNLDAGRVNAAGNYERNASREVSQLKMRNMLMEKARKDIRKKLDEWRASSVSRNLGMPNNTNVEDSKTQQKTEKGL